MLRHYLNDALYVPKRIGISESKLNSFKEENIVDAFSFHNIQPKSSEKNSYTKNPQQNGVRKIYIII